MTGTRLVHHCRWPSAAKHPHSITAAVPFTYFGPGRGKYVDQFSMSFYIMQLSSACSYYQHWEPTSQMSTHTYIAVAVGWCVAVIRLFGFFLYPVRHLQSFYASLLPASPCLSPNCLYLASFLSSPPPPALSPICYLWHASSASTQFMGVICCLKKLNNSFDLSGKMFPPLWLPERCLLASLWILKKEGKKSHSQEVWMKVMWGEMTTLTPWHTNQPS